MLNDVVDVVILTVIDVRLRLRVLCHVPPCALVVNPTQSVLSMSFSSTCQRFADRLESWRIHEEAKRGLKRRWKEGKSSSSLFSALKQANRTYVIRVMNEQRNDVIERNGDVEHAYTQSKSNREPAEYNESFGSKKGFSGPILYLQSSRSNRPPYQSANCGIPT